MSEGTQLSQEVRKSLAWDPYWLFKAVQNLPVSFKCPILHLKTLLQQLQLSPGVVAVFCGNQKSGKPNYFFPRRLYSSQLNRKKAEDKDIIQSATKAPYLPEASTTGEIRAYNTGNGYCPKTLRDAPAPQICC